MKILIADDEALARTRLRNLLTNHPQYDVVAEAAHGRDVLERVNVNKPDVVLLDIRMPGMDGLETAHHLAALEQPPAVIFTTAFDQYALQAFDAHAVGYLLKPIRQDKLLAALERATQVSRAQLQSVHQESPQAVSRSHISARVRGNLVLVELERVRYFHAEHKYVSVGYDGGELLIEESLKSLENDLAGKFIRIHRSALVALQYIRALEKIDANAYCVLLDGVERKIEVSRRHLADVRRAIKSKAG